METINTRQPTVNPGESITLREAVAWVLLFVSLTVLVAWGIQAAMEKTAQGQTPTTDGQRTTFRPVLPPNFEGDWVVQDEQYCRLAFELAEESKGSQGSVTSTTGNEVLKGTFRVTGSRMTFDFNKTNKKVNQEEKNEKTPIYFAPEIRGHGLDFEFFLTNDDRLVLIGITDGPGGPQRVQVYPFKREQKE